MNTPTGLVERLREAAAQQVGPDSVRDFVGSPPLLKGSRADGQDLSFLEVIEGEGADSLPDASSVAAVAYWKVQDLERYTRVAGLCWDDRGNSRFFQGRIWPPG